MSDRLTRNRRSSRCAVFLLALASCAGLAAQARPYDLDETVAAVMKAFDVPGMAVAVVKDGQVVSAKGYGVKTLAQPGAVDGRTLFGIASNTKAFMAAALGTLVDEGKLTWNTRVIARGLGPPRHREAGVAVGRFQLRLPGSGADAEAVIAGATCRAAGRVL